MNKPERLDPIGNCIKLDCAIQEIQNEAIIILYRGEQRQQDQEAIRAAWLARWTLAINRIDYSIRCQASGYISIIYINIMGSQIGSAAVGMFVLISRLIN